jgi:hypothetical protein
MSNGAAWSAERLTRLHRAMAGHVERGDTPSPPGVFADFWTRTYQALGD